MREAPVPHYFKMFPTGHIPVPVCIGDLPLFDYAVSQNTLVETAASHMQNNMLIPGVIVLENEKAVGVIPRHKMFERLGRRYGVELFLRRSIGELERELDADAFTLRSHLSINLAVKLALSRPESNIYDPIIIEHEDGRLYLLDMYVLLLTQSQLSNNLSGIISSLNTIDTILANETSSVSTLNLIMESMNLVVPFHHARLVLRSQDEISAILGMNEAVHLIDEPFENNLIYKSIFDINQPLMLEDTRIVPAWTNIASPDNTRSWMGIPVSNQFGTVGLLLLSRYTLSPFTINEKELAQVFARYINTLLVNLTNRVKKNRKYERMV